VSANSGTRFPFTTPSPHKPREESEFVMMVMFTHDDSLHFFILLKQQKRLTMTLTGFIVWANFHVGPYAG
jgi:hypothetical protein